MQISAQNSTNEISQTSEKSKNCGFVALIGATNAGKSTLLNALVEQKIAIVSRKIQTTRGCSVGIVSSKNTQLLLRDTPGFFQPKNELGEIMVASAKFAASAADEVVILHDIKRGITEDLTDMLATHANPILVFNKIDKQKRPELLSLIDQVKELANIKRIFMISALYDDGVSDLRDYLVSLMPEGPWLYDAEQVSDQPLSRIASELTREQIYDYCHKELPYSVSVETTSWQQQRNGVLKIEQLIYVSRKAHKPIVIGAGGSVLKNVGTASRKSLEKILNQKVFLSLRVKVHDTWYTDKRLLDNTGVGY